MLKFDFHSSMTNSVDPPWEIRARETRNSLVDTLGLGSQLEKKNIEVRIC